MLLEGIREVRGGVADKKIVLVLGRLGEEEVSIATIRFLKFVIFFMTSSNNLWDFSHHIFMNFSVVSKKNHEWDTD